MTPATSPAASYERRHDWTREEWIVAFDACPKDRQRYSATSRDVVEVAYLINRTPAAVSRSFANLWAAMTDGRAGLANYARECGSVVQEYRERWKRLHHDALILRRHFLQDSLAPRIEIRGERTGILQADDLRGFGHVASRETGVPRKLFVVYHREGSIVEGALLISNLLGGAAGGAFLLKEFVRWFESRVSERPSHGQLEILRTRTWVALGEGRFDTVEQSIISFYLPSIGQGELDEESRHALASYLDAALGVARIEAVPGPLARGAVGLARRRALERRTEADLSHLSPQSLRELNALLKAVETRGFRRAMRQLRQTRLDDFES